MSYEPIGASHLDEIDGFDHVHLLNCADRKAYCQTALLKKGYVTKCSDEDFQALHRAKCDFARENTLPRSADNVEYHRNVLRETAGARLGEADGARNLRLLELKYLMSLEFTDANGLTEAFVGACQNGQADVVRLLLADPRVDPTTNDNKAIQLAAEYGHANVVRLLLSNPATGDNHALHLAAYYGHAEVVRLLLTNAKVDAAAGNNFAIQLAAQNGNVEVVRLLLNDERVDPTADDNYAIRFAAARGRAEVVTLLLADERVDPAAKNNEAIRWANFAGHADVVRLLENA